MVAQRKRALALATALIALPLMLVACQRSQSDANLDTLDQELADKNNAANARDPALVNALQDEIMVDPQLAQQANHDAIRPPGQPYSAPVVPDATVGAARPPVDATDLRRAPAADESAGCPNCRTAQGAVTLGALAERQKDRRTSSCAGNVHYSTGWATRLPADVPLFPDARVSEAAGNDAGGCGLRVVSFATNAPPQTVIDWYYTRVSQAGFSAEHQADGGEHVLGGTRDRDGGAYMLYVYARDGGGSDVDLVTNNGN